MLCGFRAVGRRAGPGVGDGDTQPFRIMAYPPGLTLLPVLTADEVAQFRCPGFPKDAHRWLAHLRQVCAQAGLEAIDITDGLPDGVPAFDSAPTPVFDWRRYVCSLPHAWTVVGDGITRFEGRFINCPEPDPGKLQLPEPYGGFRFDFVVHRMDGRCVRLHPSHNAEAQPVIGHLEPWLVQTGTVGVHAAFLDGISSEIAERMLVARIFKAATQGGISLKQVYESVIENDWFDWVRFLQARPFGRALLKEGVTSLTLVCSDSTPVKPLLIVTTQAHPADRVISFHDGCATLY